MTDNREPFDNDALDVHHFEDDGSAVFNYETRGHQDPTHRVRLVVTDQPEPGQAVQLETKPMPETEANRVAAEAVALGIPAAVHPDQPEPIRED